MTLEVDAVVVGSGAGGPPVALQLARAGATVALLERGPRYSHKDFVHDEIRVARRNFFTPSAATDPHVIAVAGHGTEKSAEGWVSTVVGGGTVHMSGFFYRFQPSDFRVRSLLGPMKGSTLADWPVTYEEMAPFFDMVEREVGVCGPPSEGPFGPPRSGPYPMPALDNHPAVDLIDAAAQKLGVHAFPTPRAIASRPFNGRKQCTYCHLCGGFGCEVGAKSSSLDTLIPAAEATGKCTVIPNARVHRIEVGDDGRATGVVYRTAAGADVRVKARVVVVACSCIESARLLLMSTSPQHPNGLGNGNGQVGQNLVFSTLSKAHGSFRFDKDAKRAEMLKDHAPFLGRSVLDHYLPKKAKVAKAGALNFLFVPGGPIHHVESLAMRNPSGKFIWGSELKREMQHFFHEQKQLDCETFGEYLPTPGTHVTLDPEVKDSLGFPSARISIDRHSYDMDVSSYLADRAAEMLDAAGADRVWKSNLGGRTMHLPMGACRMGIDPKASATDKNARLHEVKNVFVTDGAAFASSGGVPPTFTIFANAFRVGAFIRDALARREL